MSLELYSDRDSYIYKPSEVEGFLLLNYNKLQRHVYYKFFNDKLSDNLKKIDDPQFPVTLYNLFNKYLTEDGNIEVVCLSEFDDDVDSIDEDSDTLEIEEFFGFEYNEDTDVLLVKDISNLRPI